jgi:hypothetical protein
MKVSQTFGGDSLKAADLNGKEHTVIIESVEEREFDGKPKYVVRFQGAKKALICNATNAKRIAFGHGDDTDGWIGKKIQLYVDLVDFQGKPVEAIRVRPIKKPAETTSYPKTRTVTAGKEYTSFDDSVADIGDTF